MSPGHPTESVPGNQLLWALCQFKKNYQMFSKQHILTNTTLDFKGLYKPL